MNREIGKKTIIKTPVKLIFTEEGVNHFLRKNQKLNKYRLSDNTEEYGILLAEFSPPTIQRMMLLGYVAILELPLENVRSSRKDIVDMVKLIAYGMLYRQFDVDAWGDVVRSDLIRRWNRLNPKNPIDFKTRPNTEFLRKTMEHRKDVMDGIRTEILAPVVTRLRTEENLHPREREMGEFLAEKFLRNLSPLTWFILSSYRGSSVYGEVLEAIRRRLIFSMERSGVCEYMAMLIMELLTFLEAFGKENGRNEEFEAPAGSEDSLHLIWKIRRRRNIPDDRGKLQVIICDRKSASREAGARIYNRSNVPIQERSLSDFYHDAAGSGENMNLGLYYLAYLKEVCKQMNILFDSFGNMTPEGRTLVNLAFTF